jgi:tetratricopeptide (TPR) repeat protein
MQETLRKVQRFFLIVRSGVSQALFTLALWLLVAALGLMLLAELLKKDHDPVLLATLVVLFLLVLLVNRYESVFIGRLKKIGPLELFEEVRSTLSDFEEIEKLRPSLGAISTQVSRETELRLYPQPHKLPSQESFHCQQGDMAISLLEFTNSQPEKTKYKDKYFDLLSKVGSCAYVQNDWARATARLEKLRELSADSFSPETVLPVVGLSYFYWGLEERDSEAAKKDRFSKAAEVFSKFIKMGKANYLTYFHLAYAQDELGLYFEAIEVNKETLKRRPRFAPARYNLAVSYVKFEELENAYQALTQISGQDENGLTTLKSALVDEELKPLREHPEWKDKVSLFLEQARTG